MSLAFTSKANRPFVKKFSYLTIYLQGPRGLYFVYLHKQKDYYVKGSHKISCPQVSGFKSENAVCLQGLRLEMYWILRNSSVLSFKK